MEKQNQWDCNYMVWIGTACFLYFKGKKGDQLNDLFKRLFSKLV